MQFAFQSLISLTPVFSPVWIGGLNRSRFNGFSPFQKPLKRLKRTGVRKSPG
jgi:hypothetical protein